MVHKGSSHSSKIASVFDLVEKKAFDVAGFGIWIAVVIVTANIISRYAFDYPLQWVFEATQFILVWFTLLSAAWVMFLDKHIKVDLITSRIPPKPARALEIVSSVLGAILGLVLLYFGIAVVVDLYQRGTYMTTNMEPLAWPLYLAIPVGGLLLAIECSRWAMGGRGSRVDA